MDYKQAKLVFDRHVIQYMVETGGVFGPLDTCWHIKNFVNEWVTWDMARAILRDLTDRGFCRYSNGLFTDDGEVAGAGYGLTPDGLDYYKLLCPQPPEDV